MTPLQFKSYVEKEAPWTYRDLYEKSNKPPYPRVAWFHHETHEPIFIVKEVDKT